MGQWDDEEFPDDELMSDRSKAPMEAEDTTPSPENEVSTSEPMETPLGEPVDSPPHDNQKNEKDIEDNGGIGEKEKKKIQNEGAGYPSASIEPTSENPSKPGRLSFETRDQMTEAARNRISSVDIVNKQEARLGDELKQLLKDIRRIGEEGKPDVRFGDLFDDAEVEQYYEALVGTLKSAKKRGLIDFQGQMLLKGPHDKVVISICNA